MELSPIKVGNDSFAVQIVRSGNRHAYARVRDRYVVISIPRRLDETPGNRMALGLYSRISRAMARHPERYLNETKTASFCDGQSLSVLGNSITISIVGSGRRNASGRISNGMLEIRMPNRYSEAERQAAIYETARKTITKFALPELHSMLSYINALHFESRVGKLRMASASSRWGSCTTRNGQSSIMLNFRLLFMPKECMEYVMVHELAHTRIRGHTKRFWSVVGSIIPDYKARRRMLRNP